MLSTLIYVNKITRMLLALMIVTYEGSFEVFIPLRSALVWTMKANCIAVRVERLDPLHS